MSPVLMLLLGIGGLILGLLMFAGWFDWILRVGGIVLIILGIVGVVFGGIGMIRGKGGDSYRY